MWNIYVLHQFKLPHFLCQEEWSTACNYMKMVQQRSLIIHELANKTNASVNSVRINKQVKTLHLGGKHTWLQHIFSQKSLSQSRHKCPLAYLMQMCVTSEDLETSCFRDLLSSTLLEKILSHWADNELKNKLNLITWSSGKLHDWELTLIK